MPGVARTAAAAFILTSVLLPLDSPPSRLFDVDRRHVRQLLDDGRYQLAAQYSERLLSRASSFWGPDSHTAWTASDLDVEARVLNGEGARREVLATAEDLARLKQQRLGPQHVESAASLRNLAAALLAAGEYERARQEFERVVRVLESAGRSKALQLADALNGLGDAEIRTERYDAATVTLSRALSLREMILGTTDRLVAQTLERKAFLLIQQGAYGDARPLLERALTITEAHAPTHPETAALLNTLGNLTWFEGKVVDSEGFHRRALQLARQTLAPEHPNLAVYQRDLAFSLWDLGRTSEARDMQRDALRLGRSVLAGTHPEVVSELNDLANSEMGFGEYAKAWQLYEEALAAVETRFGPTHLTAATTLHNLALLNAQLGDRVEAGRRLEQALEIWQRVLGPSHPYVGHAIDSLAEVFGKQGRFVEARSLFERAVKIRETSLGPDHREVAESLTKLAAILQRSGEPSEARRQLSRAMTIWARDESSGQSAFDGYGAALTLDGEMRVADGDYFRARQSFEKAIGRRAKLLGSTHPDIAAINVGLASAMFGLGRTTEGFRLALEAEHASRDHLRLTARYLSERDSLNYAATRQRGLDLALSSASGSQEPVATAILDALVRSRALVLEEMSQRHATVRGLENARSKATLSSVIGARQQFANLVVRGTGSDLPRGYRELLDDGRREMEAAERELAAQSAAFRSDLMRQQVGLEHVRRSLPPATVLVSFVRYHHETPWRPRSPHGAAYLAFVLAHSAPTAVLRIGSAVEVDGLVQNWRAEVTRGALVSNGSATASETAYREAGAALRQVVWDPIVPMVASSQRVFIVPDGALNLVSFASLPSGTTRYLAESGPLLHYLAAERDLALLEEELPAPGKLLAMGGPDFNYRSAIHASRGSQPTAPPPARPINPTRAASLNCSGLDSVTFQPLPATAHEVNEIATIWKRVGRLPTTLLLGAAATEEALKAEASQTGILHLATHGFFLAGACTGSASTTRGTGGVISGVAEESSPLRLSGLALAGANQRRYAIDSDDGILTAEEVAGLDLRQAQWVVLSACDTGIGEVAVGEGVLGLRRAFRIAGARTLIMSLWSVDDDATRRWMRVLYESRLVRRLDTAASTREAELTMLRERRAAHESTHPFYWASFVAVGDWR